MWHRMRRKALLIGLMGLGLWPRPGTAAPIAVGQLLFTCFNYDVHRSAKTPGKYVAVRQGDGGRSGYTIKASVYYLPDTPTKCSNFTVPPPTAKSGKYTTGTANIVIGCQDRRNTIVGSPGTDFICGGPFDDSIQGGASNDYIGSMAGNDSAQGGRGRDFIQAGRGVDSLFGGIDNDCLIGGKGYDSLNGGDQFDRCDPGDDAGVLSGCESNTYAVASCDLIVGDAQYWNADWRE